MYTLELEPTKRFTSELPSISTKFSLLSDASSLVSPTKGHRIMGGCHRTPPPSPSYALRRRDANLKTVKREATRAHLSRGPKQPRYVYSGRVHQPIR